MKRSLVCSVGIISIVKCFIILFVPTPVMWLVSQQTLRFLYLITDLQIGWNYLLKSVQQYCNCWLPAIHNINNIRIWRSPMINIVFCFQAWGFQFLQTDCEARICGHRTEYPRAGGAAEREIKMYFQSPVLGNNQLKTMEAHFWKILVWERPW